MWQVYVNNAHPGFVSTQLMRSVGDSYNAAFEALGALGRNLLAFSADDGALTQLFLATSPRVEEAGLRGRYFIPHADAVNASVAARNADLQRLAMQWTLAELRDRGFDVPLRFRLDTVDD